jgi:hypothetical protein
MISRKALFDDQAVERAAKALWDRSRAGFWQEAPTSAQEHYRKEAREVLEAARPTNDVDTAMAERVRLFNEAKAKERRPVYLNIADADALIRMMRAAKTNAAGSWFDEVIARIQQAWPEGDGRDEQ